MNIQEKNEMSNDLNVFKLIRIAAGNLPIMEFSKISGLSKSHISELERGISTNPTQETINKYSKATGLKAETIQFFIRDSENNNETYQIRLLKMLKRMIKEK